MFRPLNEVKPCSVGLLHGWVTKFVCFFSFLPLPFSKAILNTAELPFLRNIVSSLYQLFVPRFAMAVFMCINLHYRIHKQGDTSFELSSILWTVDLSKHLITARIFQKFIQLDNFVTFSVFFFSFGNRVRLNLYEPEHFRAFGK